MKKMIINKILLTVWVLSLSMICFVSCDDEDGGTENGNVTLLSFGPSGVKHGEKIKVIGTNLTKVTAIQLFPGIEIPSSAFVSQSADLIELTIPEAAERGRIVLKTPDGDIESKSILDFEAPLVSILTLPAGAKPGTDITITGENLNWVETIVFSAGVEVEKADFVSRSESEIVVTVPMSAQTGLVTFAIGGTEPDEFSPEQIFEVTLPTVTELSPTAIKHTDNLTITGTDLDLITAVTFAGDQLTSDFVSQSETEIVVPVPVGALNGQLTLHQASPVSVATEAGLTIILPKGTNISPKPATPGTDNVTITGTNLDLVDELNFSGVATPVASDDFVSQSATQIVVAVPEGAKAGGIGYKTIHGYSNSVLGVSLVIPGAGPPPLPIIMFDETTAPGGGDWSWNVGTSDKANTEQSYSGNVSWKFTTPSDGGLSEGGMTPINASAMTYFSFSIYGGPGTNGKQVACILNDNWGNYQSVTMVEGQWKEYKIALTNYPSVDKSAIVRWTFKVEGMSGSTIYVDRVGFE